MDLDEQLAAAAPPLAPRTADLERELHALAAATGTQERRRRRAVRVGLVSASVAGLMGLGTAGVAAAGLPSWVPWTTGGGSTCEMEFTASPAGPDGEPLSRSYTDAEKDRAVSAATRFLASFDYASIDEARAIAEWQESEDEVIRSQPDPAERQPRLRGDDLAVTAVGKEVWDELADHLADEGIPSELVVFGQGWRCE